MSEEILDNNASLILKSLESVNSRIRRLVSRLDTDGASLVSDKVNLDRAQNARTQILAYFNEYNDASRAVVDTFATVGPQIRLDFDDIGITIEFTDIDADIIRTFADDTFASMASIGQQTAADIGGLVYSSVLASGDIDDLTLEIQQKLIGLTDKRGTPMSAHAKTLAETKYMEIDAAITKRKADEVDIDKFKYKGSLINDSREWCVAHRNDVLTLEEIEEWRDASWQGKAPGDPFLMRGGYNCRHRWVPIQ